jgi:hypothetical protein
MHRMTGAPAGPADARRRRPSDREARAALAPAGAKDGLSRGGCHAGAEAVRALAAHDGGLESAFHGKSLGEKAFD